MCKPKAGMGLYKPGHIFSVFIINDKNQIQSALCHQLKIYFPKLIKLESISTTSSISMVAYDKSKAQVIIEGNNKNKLDEKAPFLPILTMKT